MTPDTVKAFVRTAWPMLIGHLVAWLVVVLQPLGVHVDTAVLAELLGWALGSLIYLLGRWLERQPSPVLATLGRVLLSLGIPTGQPTYPATPPATPTA